LDRDDCDHLLGSSSLSVLAGCGDGESSGSPAPEPVRDFLHEPDSVDRATDHLMEFARCLSG
jgi:hypothetical protein